MPPTERPPRSRHPKPEHGDAEPRLSEAPGNTRAREDRSRIVTARPFGIRHAGHHGFSLLIPADPIVDVDLTETLGTRSAPLIKARIPMRHWLLIDDRVRSGVNARLGVLRLPTGAWGYGENHLAVHIGWELAVLLWAIDGATDEQVHTALVNWESLAPEERWWLYHVVNGSSYRFDLNRDRGWRLALRIALIETATEEDAERAAEARRERSRLAKVLRETQTTLFGDETPLTPKKTPRKRAPKRS
jgi:hypothetical protein